VPGDHTCGREVDGLLTRSALPIYRHARDALGPAGGQHRGPADVDGLLAGLGYTTPDHVVDDRRVDTGALGQTVENLSGQVARMHSGQTAVALADRRPDRLDDDGFSHDLLLSLHHQKSP
jgi:hypothetical protein